MNIEVLKAKHGDAIFLRWKDKNNLDKIILIDSGVSETYITQIKKRFENIKKLDAFLLTHIDEDHIDGFKKYINGSFKINNFINNYFINFPELIEIDEVSTLKSYDQSTNVFTKLKERDELKKCYEVSVEKQDKIKKIFENINVIVLSPEQKQLNELRKGWLDYLEKERKKKEDKNLLKKSVDIEEIPVKSLEELALEKDDIEKDITNDSSIAFLIKSNSKSILFLGDSNPEVVSKNLIKNKYSASNKLKVDFVKLSHHGSKNNISEKFISLIDCQNFIISTNGGVNERIRHPDRKTIAKIVCEKERLKMLKSGEKEKVKEINFYFNYDKNEIEKKNGIISIYDEEKKFKFNCINLNDGDYL